MALIANSAGEISGQFTIPAGVPAGAKAVLALGQGGTMGAATFTGRGVITTEERRQVTIVITVDPLAQTFSLNESRHLGGVELWFTDRGADDVIVQIRDTANGQPGTTVLAEKRMKPADLAIGGLSTVIPFQTPVWLTAGTEYALVILTDGAAAAVAVAELGGFDTAAQKRITAQPYQVGVLFSSSNNRAWTAHQTKDLSFRLLGARFTGLSKTIPLGTIAAVNATDLLAILNIEIPATGCGAELQATAPDGTVYRMIPGQPLNLPAGITGTLALALKLTGTTTASPVVYPGMSFITGTIHLTDQYVSRAFACGNNARLSVTFEAFTPGTSSIAVEVQKADGTWQAVPFSSAVDVGDGWVERRHLLTGFSATTTRVRLTPTGTAQYRPSARKLRAVSTD